MANIPKPIKTSATPIMRILKKYPTKLSGALSGVRFQYMKPTPAKAIIKPIINCIIFSFLLVFSLVPVRGIEPLTYALQVRCSTD